MALLLKGLCALFAALSPTSRYARIDAVGLQRDIVEAIEILLSLKILPLTLHVIRHCLCVPCHIGSIRAIGLFIWSPVFRLFYLVYFDIAMALLTE